MMERDSIEAELRLLIGRQSGGRRIIDLWQSLSSLREEIMTSDPAFSISNNSQEGDKTL